MGIKILFFSTAIEHTTFRKTVRMLTKEGVSGLLIGFTRNNFPPSEDGLPVECLGTLQHGNYFRRIIILLQFIRVFRKRANDFDVVYTFALDGLLISKIALLFKKKKTVYHIQDIRTIFFGKSLKSKLARKIEKYLLNTVDLLVVSSVDFYTGYFSKLYGFPREKVIVVENKLETAPKIESEDNVFHDINQVIRIGYFGVMRCTRSWEILKYWVKDSERFSLYMRGKPTAIPDLMTQIASIINIEYGGMYRSPEEVPIIYQNVDIVWAAYPFSNETDGNWQYARTIRFYEACAFKKPMIVQLGTPQAKDVEKYNIGMAIDMRDVTSAVNALKAINFEKIKEWEANIANLSPSTYIHSGEYKAILQALD